MVNNKRHFCIFLAKLETESYVFGFINQKYYPWKVLPMSYVVHEAKKMKISLNPIEKNSAELSQEFQV